MPEGTKVARCVDKLAPKVGKASAIRICQESTGYSYMTGKPAKTHQNAPKTEKKDK